MEQFFPFLTATLSSGFGGKEKRKDARDMLRSLHRDEQSLFNLMFVRMSIISPGCGTWKLAGRLAAQRLMGGSEKCFIYIPKTKVAPVSREACQTFQSIRFFTQILSTRAKTSEKLSSHFEHSFHCTVWFRVRNWFLVIRSLFAAAGKHGTQGEKAVWIETWHALKDVEIVHEILQAKGALASINPQVNQREPTQIKLTDSFETFQSTFSKHHSETRAKTKEW